MSNPIHSGTTALFIFLHSCQFGTVNIFRHIHAQVVLSGWFVEQKLMLSSSFRFDQIYNCQRYDLVTLCCAT
jgi:hypothetical protein